MSNLKVIPKGIYGFILVIILIVAALFVWYMYIAVSRRGHLPSLATFVNQNIRIAGKCGAMTYNIYIESNPSDSNGYYSIYRVVYDAIKYDYNPMNFDTLGEIRKHCDFLVRKKAGANSLVYTDWDVNVSSNDKFYHLYVVTQDDGDFSKCVIFK